MCIPKNWMRLQRSHANLQHKARAAEYWEPAMRALRAMRATRLQRSHEVDQLPAVCQLVRPQRGFDDVRPKAKPKGGKKGGSILPPGAPGGTDGDDA